MSAWEDTCEGGELDQVGHSLPSQALPVGKDHRFGDNSAYCRDVEAAQRTASTGSGRK